MSTSVEFSTNGASRGATVTVTGPRADLRRALHASPKAFTGRKVSGRHIYEMGRDQEAELETCVVNARAAGKIHNPERRKACIQGINTFFSEIVWQANSRNNGAELAGNARPKLSVTEYAPLGNGEFVIDADIQKPLANSIHVTDLATRAMINMATDLGAHEPQKTLQPIFEHIQGATFYGKSGLLLPVSNMGRAHPPRHSWNWDEERFRVTGENIVEGAEPLIVLAGMIAIAHADELLAAKSVVQER